jgi:hypothetical protein
VSAFRGEVRDVEEILLLDIRAAVWILIFPHVAYYAGYFDKQRFIGESLYPVY